MGRDKPSIGTEYSSGDFYELYLKGKCSNSTRLIDFSSEIFRGYKFTNLVVCDEKILEFRNDKFEGLSYPNTEKRAYYKIGDVILIQKESKYQFLTQNPDFGKAGEDSLSDMIMLILGMADISDFYYTVGKRIVGIVDDTVIVRDVLLLKDNLLESSTVKNIKIKSLNNVFDAHRRLDPLMNILLGFTDFSMDVAYFAVGYAVAPGSSIVRRLGIKGVSWISKKTLIEKIMEFVIKAMYESIKQGVKKFYKEVHIATIKINKDSLSKKERDELYKGIISTAIKSFLKDMTENVIDELIKLRYPKKGALIDQIKLIVKRQGDKILAKIITKPIFNSYISAVTGSFFNEDIAIQVLNECVNGLKDSVKSEFLQLFKNNH